MEIGDKLSFTPSAWTQFSGANVLDTYGVELKVRGTVIWINAAHRYARVEYTAGGCINHECFKF